MIKENKDIFVVNNFWNNEIKYTAKYRGKSIYYYFMEIRLLKIISIYNNIYLFSNINDDENIEIENPMIFETLIEAEEYCKIYNNKIIQNLKSKLNVLF